LFIRSKCDWKQTYFCLVEAYRNKKGRPRQYVFHLGKTLNLSAEEWAEVLCRVEDNATENATAKVLSAVRNYAKKHGLSLPRAAEKTEERFFTAEQVKRIIAASEEPYSTLWAVLALTGCRAGEILALRRGDLDFDKRIIRIRRTLDGATRLTHAPKSKSSSADLPMPTALETRLRNFLAEHWRANESDLLFCNRKGKPMQRDKAAFILQETLTELGIEKAAFHAFRHMAASELLESGAAPSVVQRQMRHSDARITLQSYGHIIGDAQRTAMNSLSERVL
jgi:integrase